MDNLSYCDHGYIRVTCTACRSVRTAIENALARSRGINLVWLTVDFPEVATAWCQDNAPYVDALVISSIVGQSTLIERIH